ncbi:hypothetical protein BH23CHL7_BH23CHL7_23890 [soil metagenome]
MLASVVVLAGIGVAAVVLMRDDALPTSPTPISRVDTQDVHSLAFLGSPDRIVLGHHGGILESTDGGGTWTPWGTGADAMAMGVAGEEPIVVAGHNVLAVGRRDGRWEDIPNDLPNTDIHGFARDPSNPSQMWAYLAAGGLYQSSDGGLHWEQVFSGHAFGLFAVARDSATRLVAVDPERGAIVASDDGGRTWEALSSPPSTPVYAMTGTGTTILYSGSDGLFRSDDGGRMFRPLVHVGQPILAVAITEDRQVIVIATRDRSIYRSEDGGQTWTASRSD